MKIQNDKWKAFRNDVNEAFTSIDKAYKDMGPLIIYLEKAMIEAKIFIDKPFISDEFKKIKELFENITK